ncbi:DHBP synthase RibB-like alpha/beta domain-containing protein [Chytriomyces sp. MP71]|nr:DHBP synthase RibB-like alpha/beta domain-containing protein [Chytriomyces sp. MP71]
MVLRVSPSSFSFDDDGRLRAPEGREQAEDHARLALAAQVLAYTSLPVAFPTETVYGLGANALNREAVANVFRAKGRPSDNPLIVHTSSLDMTRTLVAGGKLPDVYASLIDQHWPGPLTLLLPRAQLVPDAVTAGHPSVAVRMPSHPVARALIALSGVPVAAPSANTSTRPSPTRASHVHDDLRDRILLLVDGGSCDGGIESTVVDALRTPPAILRPGGVTAEMIRKVPGFQDAVVWKKKGEDPDGRVPPSSGEEDEADLEAMAPVTPGMKYKHYAPKVPVVFLLSSPSTYTSTVSSACSEVSQVIGILRTETLPAFSFLSLPLTSPPVYLHQVSLGTTHAQVGSNLFHALRECESVPGLFVVFVEGVAEVDEGLAVMNRVRKAAGDTVYV